MSAPFGTRLQEAVAEHGPLLAGIDPHAALLEAWGLPDDPGGLRTFGLRVIEALAGRVAAIKPQSAFFERHGSAGVAVLEEVLAAARSHGLLSILDVKRGDIGSTMGGYAAAHLLPGAPLEADAITLSPYLGFGSLDPALALAREHGKGAFVLVLTSNPDGASIQHATDPDGRSVARGILEQVAALAPTGGAWGSIGAVIGATTGRAVRELGLDRVLREAPVPVLAPGFGAQGAGPAQRDEVFGPAAGRVLVSISRSLLAAGPEASDLAREADALQASYQQG